MDADKLDELKRLLTEASDDSPLPWSTSGCTLYDANDLKLADYLDPPEAALIVAAINALPELVAMAKELDAARAELAEERLRRLREPFMLTGDEDLPGMKPGIHMCGASDAEGNRFRVSYVINEDGRAHSLRIEKIAAAPDVLGKP